MGMNEGYPMVMGADKSPQPDLTFEAMDKRISIMLDEVNGECERLEIRLQAVLVGSDALPAPGLSMASPEWVDAPHSLVIDRMLQIEERLRSVRRSLSQLHQRVSL